jgi:hypothetical protein
MKIQVASESNHCFVLRVVVLIKPLLQSVNVKLGQYDSCSSLYILRIAWYEFWCMQCIENVQLLWLIFFIIYGNVMYIMHP